MATQQDATISPRDMLDAEHASPPAPASPAPRAGVLLELPEELLENVILALAPREMMRFVRTCRKLHQLSHQPHVWSQLCWRVGCVPGDVDKVLSTLAASSAPASPEDVPRTEQEKAVEVEKQKAAVRVLKALFAEQTVPRRLAAYEMEGAWLEADYNAPREDPMSCTGTVLRTNVWWLDFSTTLIVPNGTWDILARLRGPTNHWYGAFPDVNVTLTVEYPRQGARPSSETTWHLAQTLTARVVAGTFPSVDFAHWRHPLGPVDVRSPVGYARVTFNMYDHDTSTFKSGMCIDYIEAVRTGEEPRLVHWQDKRPRVPGSSPAPWERQSMAAMRELEGTTTTPPPPPPTVTDGQDVCVIM
ncbi:hypothetical protein AMAG_09460 [Allomyces macrogynus ATCC 38327]|uniref:F-box domain-containing protein n=1 Tax=Allomyces macrogynus (strain ATCC 38327) TaxID=578462 RepID=A0A0L0SPK5_ALLM3|nr:hypothetical protein AMAG_09460 [Allomyces macrogynus ATCC 38327]|eukprot:KNE64438.1 hypothetical protein AMAG_09460 [Allomyces macrogynus ATCC 38327]